MVRIATVEDAGGMLQIYGRLVRDTTITFEYEPPSLADFEKRISDTLDRYPWLVFERDEAVAGYAYAGPHRNRPAYRWSVETSVYVAAQHRRTGVGRALYSELLELLAEREFHMAYAGTTLPNSASIALHKSLGFEPVGLFRAVGFKFGQWHDVAWWQRRLRPVGK